MPPISLGHMKVYSDLSSPSDPATAQFVSQKQNGAVTDTQKFLRPDRSLPQRLLSTYQLQRVQYLTISSQENPIMVIYHYKDDTGRWFVIKKYFEPQTEVRIPAVLDQGLARGQPVVFFTKAVAVQAQSNTTLNMLVGLWEQDGLLMELQGPNLMREEIVTAIEAI